MNSFKSALPLNADLKHREIQKEKNIPYTIKQFSKDIANKDVGIDDLQKRIAKFSKETITGKDLQRNGVLGLTFSCGNLDVVKAVIAQIKLLNDSSLIRDILSIENRSGLTALERLADEAEDVINPILEVLLPLESNDSSEKEFSRAILRGNANLERFCRHW